MTAARFVRSGRGAATATLAAGALSVGLLAVSPVSASSGQPLSIVYADCTEFIGLAHIDRDLASPLLPADFDTTFDYGDFGSSPPIDIAVVIVRSVTCEQHTVNGRAHGEVDLSQVGVVTALTDAEDVDLFPGTGLDNFQLEFITDSPRLASAMNSTGAHAIVDPDLEVDIDVDQLIDVEIDARPRYEAEGGIGAEATFPSPFIAHWWGRNGNTTVRSQQLISLMQFHLDFTGDVSVEAGNAGVLADLLGNGPVAYNVGIIGEIPVGNVTIGSATPGA